MDIRRWYPCYSSDFIAFILLLGLVQIGYGQTRTYLTGQKTGNKVQAGSLIGLGTGSAGLATPMQEYGAGCLLGAELSTPFRFYYGDQNILTGATTHYVKLTAARTLGALGLLGSGADVYIQFRNTNNNVITAGTTTYFKLKEAPTSFGINLDVGKLIGVVPLVSIKGRGYKNSLNYKFQTGGWGALCTNPYNGNENNGILAGSENGTKTKLLIDPLGEWYVSVTPDEDYNAVRLSVAYPTFDLNILSATSEINVNVYNAFTETAGSSCSIMPRYSSPGEATGINLNTGALGLNLSQLIANPHRAINDDSNQYASYSSGVLGLGVANTVSQTAYFDHVASVADGVRVRLGLSDGLIDLGIANNLINFIAYNGESGVPVWSSSLYELVELLDINLLDLFHIGTSHGEIDMVFKPGVAFDRIKIEFNAGLLGLGVLGDALRVYTISLAPSAPEITKVGQPDNISICEGETASFKVNVTVPIGSSVLYQWQSWNGTMWQDISEKTSSILTLPNVPLSDNNKRYRVQVLGGNPNCPQTIYSNPARLTVDAKPGKPHLTITDVVNE